MLWIVLAILLHGWVLFGFHDLRRFHSSTMVQGFLESWWFTGFLRGRLISEETEVFVCFYAFGCYGCFWVGDEWFTDFVILRDSIALPRCMGF